MFFKKQNWYLRWPYSFYINFVGVTQYEVWNVGMIQNMLHNTNLSIPSMWSYLKSHFSVRHPKVVPQPWMPPLAFTYYVCPSRIVVWSKLELGPPFPNNESAWSVIDTGTQSHVWRGTKCNIFKIIAHPHLLVWATNERWATTLVATTTLNSRWKR